MDVIPRAAWLAAQHERRTPVQVGGVRFAVVHHTVIGHGASRSDVPAVLREIFLLHTRENGWDDIGYNLLVDPFGRVWEGRAGGVTRAVVGAHTSGHNATSTGIALVGDHSADPASARALAALGALLRFKLAVHELDVLPSTVRTHRELAATLCPGDALHAQVERLRAPTDTRRVGQMAR